MELWNELNASKTNNDDDVVSIARWQARNLAEMHQVIGVTCNQIDHLMDSESQTFDLAIVDECSKATMPEWLMAMSVAKKCILVGTINNYLLPFVQKSLKFWKNGCTKGMFNS